MINLGMIKKKQQDASANGTTQANKRSAGEIRIQKDMSELNLPKGWEMKFPEGKDKMMRFDVVVHPQEGYYKGGAFLFSFDVPAAYPHEPPKVLCKTKLYHPNIDLDGKVCLNVLRDDWKPILNVNAVLYGLNLLFLEPNEEDPLNKEAGQALKDNPRQFEANVRNAMLGGYVGGHEFDRCIR